MGEREHLNPLERIESSSDVFRPSCARNKEADKMAMDDEDEDLMAVTTKAKNEEEHLVHHQNGQDHQVAAVLKIGPSGPDYG